MMSISCRPVNIEIILGIRKETQARMPCLIISMNDATHVDDERNRVKNKTQKGNGLKWYDLL